MFKAVMEKYNQDYNIHVLARSIKQSEIVLQCFANKTNKVEDKKCELVNAHYPDQDLDCCHGLLIRELTGY